jgi:hypothetical protein
MSTSKTLTASEKREENREALEIFALDRLKPKLPLVFACDPDLPPSPKPRYRSDYQPLGLADLKDDVLDTFSNFEIGVRLFDYSALEPFLAKHLYKDSAKGQVPFHPLSMYLLTLYRRSQDHSRHEVLRILRHPTDGQALRRCTGFKDDFPSESGLRYFEGQLTPEVQKEILALQVDVLYQAGLLPVKPDVEEDPKAVLSFDGMLHKARSRLRCSSVTEDCYEPAPRPCAAKAKKKRGCDCTDDACDAVCRHATARDPEARFVVYTGNNKHAHTSPNTPVRTRQQRSRASRMLYGYYSYAGQILDDELATYWALPAAFGAATCGDPDLFPDNFAYLQHRFEWLDIGEVLADAGACEQTCLDAIWKAGALRMVDIRAHTSDRDPETRLARGYDEHGYPLCPHGYVLHSNGYEYDRRRAKWRCAKRCQRDAENPPPACPFLKPDAKHGYTTTVGRTHADGSVRLAREIPYDSPAWKERYGRRNCAESRNSILQRFGLKRMPVHGFDNCHVVVLQGEFLANQNTLIRLIREAAALE